MERFSNGKFHLRRLQPAVTRRRQSTGRALLFVWMTIVCQIPTRGWAWQGRIVGRRELHQKILQRILVGPAVASLSVSVSVPVEPVQALDASGFAPEELLKSLTPATKERPAITVDSAAMNTAKIRNIPPPTSIEVLVALSNPQAGPSPTDSLIIEVFDGPQRSTLLGGAKIPISKLRRFPVQIKMTAYNAKTGMVGPWKELASKQDLWLVASIVSNDEGSSDGPRLEAEGISKLVSSIPGVSQSILQTYGRTSGIRLPSSLTLTNSN